MWKEGIVNDSRTLTLPRQAFDSKAVSLDPGLRCYWTITSMPFICESIILLGTEEESNSFIPLDTRFGKVGWASVRANLGRCYFHWAHGVKMMVGVGSTNDVRT